MLCAHISLISTAILTTLSDPKDGQLGRLLNYVSEAFICCLYSIMSIAAIIIQRQCFLLTVLLLHWGVWGK